MSYPPVLAREFYQRPTEVVARELLGKLVVRTHPDGVAVLRVNEVEAYLGVDDPACHTSGGRRTARTETMWGEAGHAYIYLVYGLHNCFNVVTVGPEQPEAVLVRGGAVVKGLDLVRARRGRRVGERSLTDGPGKLCQALAITREDDCVDLCSPESTLQICDDGVVVPEGRVRRVPRVGVDYAGEAVSWPLRLITDSMV
ncbi:MAG: DNA-3-methyladenine glycosylase [Acidobacteria bacterium]|nr:DNA-3-methyladenine glycosylase [Candidatus Sulfomarinibacter sp. MAG AM1]